MNHGLRIAEVCLVGFLLSGACGADWPAYQADASRSGTVSEGLTYPLAKRWTYMPLQPPRPAWPEPGKELHRMDFDYAFQPIVADGILYFGSSADDTIRALDAGTGALRWRYTVGGPIRFAPEYGDGNIYVASDDGYLYCLDAGSGSLRWRFQGAPGDDLLLGNGRMISRWPLRTGVLAATDGTVYLTAGMWPAEGVHIYALDAETGRVLWQNNRSGFGYMRAPHSGAAAFTGVAPQGYLLASGNVLVVPTGRSVPAAFDRRTGEFLYYRHGPANHDGGAWATIGHGLLFNRKHIASGPKLKPAAHVGESDPMPGDGLAAFALATGVKLGEVAERHTALLGEHTIYAVGNGQAEALDLRKWRLSEGGSDVTAATWAVEHERCYSMALAGDALLLGGQGSVTAFNRSDGTKLWRDSVDGQARGLAVAAGRLFVAMNDGRITCYGSEPIDGAPVVLQESARAAGADQRTGFLATAAAIVKAHRIVDGYALVVGGATCDLAAALVRQSRLHVIAILRDDANLVLERERLVASGLYGSRIALLSGQKLRLGSLPPYFADLVVVESGDIGLPAQELYRCVRPCGGLMAFPDSDSPRVLQMLRAAGVPSEEIHRTAGSPTVVRGPLPGAGEWRHHWADAGRTGVGMESRLKLPLSLLWFGGPGPDRMKDRHSATATPVSVAGRTFVTGEQHLIAFSAYNGRELWAREIPSLARARVRSSSSNLVADDRVVYVAVGATCCGFDQATGELVRSYRVPIVDSEADESSAWGYLSVVGESVLGSCGGNTPAAEATAVFALDRETGDERWLYRANGVIDNVSLAVGDGKLYLIDAEPQETIAAARRRGERPSTNRTLVAVDLADGHVVWRQEDVPNAWHYVQYVRGVVVVHANAAYDAQTGRKLWQLTGRIRPDRLPVIYDDWIIAPPRAYQLATGEPVMLRDVLTERTRPWTLPRAYGCSGIAGCKGLLFFRSGTIGFFDMAEGGLTTFGGVRAGCGVTMVAANGLLVCAEASSGCSCGYNFQTSLALAPAGRETGKPWYVFARQPSDDLVNCVRLNFGAPGDRRDQKGNAWLAYPRSAPPDAAPDPVQFSMSPSHWHWGAVIPAQIRASQTPWLYTSAVSGRGTIAVETSLEHSVVAAICRTPPLIDGKPDDACWQGCAEVRFKDNTHRRNPQVTLLMCQDAENFYLAYQRKAARREGELVPFSADQIGDDAQVWLDDAVEVFLTDHARETCLWFGLSCSGGRFQRRQIAGAGRWIDPPKWRPDWWTDPDWHGRWDAAVVKTAERWTAELCIPRSTLADAGLDPQQLEINAQSWNRSGVGRPCIYLKHFSGLSRIDY